MQELLKLEDTKSQGPDGIPAKLLKELAVELAEPLQLLFRASLNTGQLPSELEDSVESHQYTKEEVRRLQTTTGQEAFLQYAAKSWSELSK
ncbi:unnamed protein product [Dibothriocephalus latus]|uniref:Uncharacterized protein n=1 Tax=Dibothriocephalus latus TaxID=60516 RepID=A0A3P7PKS8_DIBLA|nr:unnamed protein product [Dibothriocephalus latus]